MKKTLVNTAEPLAGLSVFRLVARLGSFSRAANQLHVSASAVSQKIRALESRLGVRLFHRNSRQVALTEAGQDFLAGIAASLDGIDRAIEQLRGGRDQPAGLLRITLPQLAADLLVMPRLEAFLAAYPQVQLELFVDNALNDVIEGGFDAGIRFGAVLDKDMVARPLDHDQRPILVAAPRYLQLRGTPQVPDDLAEHDCIRFRLPRSGRLAAWQFISGHARVEINTPARLVFTDDRLVREATRAGLGISRQYLDSVQTDLAEGRLVEVLANHTMPVEAGFCVYFPAREMVAPKLRAFIAFFSADDEGRSARENVKHA